MEQRNGPIMVGVGCGCATMLLLVCVVTGLAGFVFYSTSAGPSSQIAEPVSSRPLPPQPILVETPGEDIRVVSTTHLAVVATITSFSGPSIVRAAQTCNFDVEQRFYSNQTTNCHVIVRCGDNVVLYGSASTGFFRCEFAQNPPRIVGSDTETTAADTDGAFTIDTTQNLLELRDDASGAVGAFDLRATISSVR